MLTCNKIVINIHPISNRLCWSHQMLCIFVDKKWVKHTRNWKLQNIVPEVQGHQPITSEDTGSKTEHYKVKGSNCYCFELEHGKTHHRRYSKCLHCSCHPTQSLIAQDSWSAHKGYHAAHVWHWQVIRTGCWKQTVLRCLSFMLSMHQAIMSWLSLNTVLDVFSKKKGVSGQWLPEWVGERVRWMYILPDVSRLMFHFF